MTLKDIAAETRLIVDECYRDSSGDAHRRCPQCGRTLTEGGRGLGKVFCAACDCRKKFHNAANADGKVIIVAAKTWYENRHAAKGTREAELCRIARQHLGQVLRELIARDRESGKPPIAGYFETLLRSGTIYADRTRK